MNADLKSIPGIAEAQPIRIVRVVFRHTPVLLAATDMESLGTWASAPRIAGDPATMFHRTAQGNGVIVSDNLALQQGLKLGEVVDLPAPAGPLHLPILGIVTDYSSQQGAIFMDRFVFERGWHDSAVNMFRIYLQRGAAADDVKRRILERFRTTRRLFVFTNGQVRDYILHIADQWLRLTYIQLAVATLIAVLGIFNNLTVSITDRRRELSVLQAIGGERRQVRQTLWMEAAVIGVLGLILGVSLGALNLEYNLDMVRQNFAGLRLGYHFPMEIVVLLVPIILVASVIAAVAPAEFAVRSSLVEGLECE